MELEILKKKLSSFKSEKGRITKVSDDLLSEILSAWENWPGTAKDFYQTLGSNQKKMARMIGKAKKLKREGLLIPFQEIEIPEAVTPTLSSCEIEIQDKNKIIRFKKVETLIEYLKKAG